MSEKLCYPWEYEEQVNLLRKYLDFNQNLLSELEGEIKKISIATLPNQTVPKELCERVKRIVNDVIDVWISEFLK